MLEDITSHVQPHWAFFDFGRKLDGTYATPTDKIVKSARLRTKVLSSGLQDSMLNAYRHIIDDIVAEDKIPKIFLQPFGHFAIDNLMGNSKEGEDFDGLSDMDYEDQGSGEVSTTISTDRTETDQESDPEIQDNSVEGGSQEDESFDQEGDSGEGVDDD